MIVKVIEESGRKTVMRDLHRPVKGQSKGWGNHTLKSLIRLIKRGDEHGKAERLLQVNTEISAPRFIWQELDTYNVGVIKGNSESTMYTLLKELESAKDWTYLLPLFYSGGNSKSVKTLFDTYKAVKHTLKKDRLRVLMKSILPEGFLQTRTRIFSYQTLRRMYHQRKYHLLPWWNEFFSELIPQLKEKVLVLETWDLKEHHRKLIDEKFGN